MTGPEKLRAAAGEPLLKGWETEIRADYANHNGKCKNCKVCYLLKLLDDSRALAAPVPAAPAQLRSARTDAPILREAIRNGIDSWGERGDCGEQGVCPAENCRKGLADSILAYILEAAQPDTARPEREVMHVVDKVMTKACTKADDWFDTKWKVSPFEFRRRLADALAAQPATVRPDETEESK